MLKKLIDYLQERYQEYIFNKAFEKLQREIQEEEDNQ